MNDPCEKCGKPMSEHGRDVMWEEWECPDPLDDVMKKIRTDDKKLREKLQERLREAASSIPSPQERHRRDLERKKPQPEVGVCRVCGGKVTEEYHLQTEPFTMHTPIGPPLHSWWESSGLYCHDCGLSYHRLPNPPEDK